LMNHNTTNQKELKNLIVKSDVLIVSPGRFRDVNEVTEKKIIQFQYSL